MTLNKSNVSHMKITILDGYSVNPGDLSWDAIKEFGEVTVYDRTSPEETVERCKGADAVLTNKVVIGKEELSQLPGLKYIGVLATGYNVVDTEAARKAGVAVTNIPAYSTDSVAQTVMALLLTITNHAEYYAMQNREGRWSKNPDFTYWDSPLIELAGKRLGVVGYGNIGQAVCRLASALGMKTAAYTSKEPNQLREVEKMDLDRLFKECDVVSLHCPLTPETHHLVDSRRLSMMKPTAILINTGRGPLVDEEALALALDEEKIYAAGLDVLSSEPPKADNPLLSARNCYITPHIGWASKEARERLTAIAADNLRAFIAGESRNRV